MMMMRQHDDDESEISCTMQLKPDSVQKGWNDPWSFECKILRIIYGPIQENTQWRIRYNDDIYGLFNMLPHLYHLTKKT